MALVGSQLRLMCDDPCVSRDAIFNDLGHSGGQSSLYSCDNGELQSNEWQVLSVEKAGFLAYTS